TRVGVIFPGQGSQGVGMGADVATRSPAAAALLERASSLLGYDLLGLLAYGPEEKLRETRFSQPAIFATNLALYAAVGEELQPVVSAGHSFGEFCSLVVARAIEFDDALRIVDERGQAMQHAAELAPGGMSAILGLDADRVRAIAEATQSATGARVQLANFNSPTQIVISGDVAAVAQAAEAMLSAGAKRVVPLNVSGAWHSDLMEPAIARFGAAVDRAHFGIPAFDVISNVDARPYRDVATIKQNLVRSIAHEVRWHDAAQRLLSYDLDCVVEFGASGVLGPLVRRLPGAPRVLVVSDYAGVQQLRAVLSAGGGDEALAGTGRG
ncbi:MAG TPA: ACP S-malonyltransferase, partial [Candidatus Tumulicola sp.]